MRPLFYKGLRPCAEDKNENRCASDFCGVKKNGAKICADYGKKIGLLPNAEEKFSMADRSVRL